MSNASSNQKPDISDWVVDKDYNPGNPASDKPDISDWIVDKSSEPQEGWPYSAAMAIPRVVGDLVHKGYDFAQQLPGYYEKAKTEVPGLFNPTDANILSGGQQAIAGGNEAINTLGHIPANLAEYASKRLHLLPESVPNFLNKMNPDTTQAINELFDQPSQPGEALLRGVTRNAPALVGGNATLSSDLLPYLTKAGASRNLQKARELGLQKNIGPLEIPHELIEDMRQYLPNTSPYRNAINDAHSGDYDKLFNLQSDAGKNVAGYVRSLFSAAERAHGREGLQARGRLINAMHESLKAQGHEDISNALRQGQEDYRRYMKFRPYRNMLGGAAIAALIPKNAITRLGSKILEHGI